MSITYCRVYCFIVVIILAFGCDRAQQFERFDTLNALPLDETLQGKRISVEDETDLLEVWHLINILDEYLVVFEQKQVERGMFQVFRLPELEFLYYWGYRGEGPDEFPGMVVHNSFNVSDEHLIIYDPWMSNFRSFSVTDTAFVLAEELTLSYQYGTIMNHMRRVHDSLYVVRARRPLLPRDDLSMIARLVNLVPWFQRSETEEAGREYIAFRPDQRDTLFTFGNYPESRLEGQAQWSEFHSGLIIKPDGSRFVSFYLYHNMFKILDENGDEVRAVKVNDPGLPEPSIDEDSANRIMYRSNAYTSDNYIYALAYNAPNGEIFVGAEGEEELRPSLEIWNWEGRAIYRAMFDRNVAVFTVSEKYGKLYAISPYDAHHIYEYDIPEILEFKDASDLSDR